MQKTVFPLTFLLQGRGFQTFCNQGLDTKQADRNWLSCHGLTGFVCLYHACLLPPTWCVSGGRQGGPMVVMLEKTFAVGHSFSECRQQGHFWASTKWIGTSGQGLIKESGFLLTMLSQFLAKEEAWTSIARQFYRWELVIQHLKNSRLPFLWRENHHVSIFQVIPSKASHSFKQWKTKIRGEVSFFPA